MDTTKQTLEQFLSSDDFRSGVTSATKASWGGSGYSVEIFDDGHWRVLWDNEIGNLYRSSGVIFSLPTLDDDDYQECLDAGMSEEEYFETAFFNQQEELEREMYSALKDSEIMAQQYREAMGE